MITITHYKIAKIKLNLNYKYQIPTSVSTHLRSALDKIV